MAEALSWAFDPTASRILERLLNAEQLPLDAKQKIYNVFEDKCTQLAIDKVGSHVVDALFRLADIDMKVCLSRLVLQEFISAFRKPHVHDIIQT